MKKSLFLSILLIKTLYFALDATIKIQTSDGYDYSFNIEKLKTLKYSQTIKNMLEDLEDKDTDSIIPLPEISKTTFDKVLFCLELLTQYELLGSKTKKKKKQQLQDTLERFNVDELHNVVQAASYLHIPDLLRTACQIWSDNHELACFENDTMHFDNQEIIEILAELRQKKITAFLNKEHLKHCKPSKTKLRRSPYCITCIDYHPVDTLLASGTTYGTILIWETNKEKLIQQLKGHNARISSVAFSPIGKTLASSSWDRTLRIWNLDSGACIRILIDTRAICTITYEPDGLRIAAGLANGKIHVWNTETEYRISMYGEHAEEVLCVCYSLDGELLASGSTDGSICIHQNLLSPKTNNAEKILHFLYDHTKAVNALCLTPDGKSLISGSSDSTIRFWDILQGCCFKLLQVHNNSIKSICYSPNKDIFAVGSCDGSLRFYDAKTIKCLNVIRSSDLDSFNINNICFSPNGNILATNSYGDEKIKLWNLYGSIGDFSNTSYERLLLLALCKEKLENNQKFNISHNQRLMEIFNTLPAQKQAILSHANIALPIWQTAQLRLLQNKKLPIKAIKELMKSSGPIGFIVATPKKFLMAMDIIDCVYKFLCNDGRP